MKEKITSGKIVAVAVALCGLAMYGHTLAAFNIGIVTGLVAGVFDGLGNAIRKTLRGVDRGLAVMYPYAVGSIFALIVALLSGERWTHGFMLTPVVAMVVFAALMVGLSNLLLYGFQHFDVNVGTVILATELFFAMLLGVLFFREIPATTELLGGLCIFGASALTVVDLPHLLSELSGRLK